MAYEALFLLATGLEMSGAAAEAVCCDPRVSGTEVWNAWAACKLALTVVDRLCRRQYPEARAFAVPSGLCVAAWFAVVTEWVALPEGCALRPGGLCVLLADTPRARHLLYHSLLAVVGIVRCVCFFYSREYFYLY